MSDYANLCKNDVQAIADDYSLNVVSFEAMEGGADNFNYLLCARQGDYVLTIGDEMTPADADIIGRLLLLLAEREFPAPRLLPPEKGGATTTYKGKPVTVKKYIIGQVRQDLDEAMLRQIGAAMARLHHIPAPDFLHGKQPFGLPHFASIEGRNINPEFEAWATRRLAYLEQRTPPGLPQGLVHGDVFYDNVLFEGQKLAAIIDFAEAIYYYKSFDLGMGIVGLCSEEATLALDKARALASGYQQVRALIEVEKQALQTLAEYAATLVACWRFWKFHFYAPSEAQTDRHRQMERLAKEIGAIPGARFAEAIFG